MASTDNLQGESTITPLEYDAKSPYKYNNFVYRIDLSNPLTEQQIKREEKPGPSCCQIPVGCQHFVLRIVNPLADSMHNESRTENEVGMLRLASASAHQACYKTLARQMM